MAIDLSLANLIRTLRGTFYFGKGSTHYLKRDGDDLKFKDPNNTEKTLTQLAASGTPELTKTFTQVSHGIAQWKWVYNGAGTWTVSSGNILSTHPEGLVTAVTTDTLTICFGGLVSRPSHGLTVGAWYYAVASGDVSTTPSDHWSVPAMIPVDADTLLVVPRREIATRRAHGTTGYQFSATVDNFEPGNSTIWKECVAAWVEPLTADQKIKGFKAQDDTLYPQTKFIFNASATYNIIIGHLDSVTAADDIRTFTQGNAVIPPQGGGVLVRHPGEDKWWFFGGLSRPTVLSYTVTANQTELKPTGYNYKETWRLDADGNYDIHGFPAAGRFRSTHVNVSSSYTLTYKHNSGSITGDAVALELPGGFDIWLAPGESITWEYDVTTGRYRPVAHTPAVPIEREQHLPRPEQPYGQNSVSAYQSAPAPYYLRGAIYRTDRDIEFNRIILRRTTSATGTMRVVIYQAPNGEAIDGDWSKVYEGTFAWAGTEVIVHDTTNPVRLRKGRFAFLFAMTTTVYFWIDCYTISVSFNMINDYMPAEVYPGNFETTISAGSTAPAVFDPVADASADGDNHTAILRLRTT